MIDVLTEICNRIWRTGEWPTPWTQSLIITLPKKGNSSIVATCPPIPAAHFAFRLCLIRFVFLVRSFCIL